VIDVTDTETSSPATGAVHWAVDGSVRTIELDSPPANALGYELIDGLDAALSDAEGARARVLVLTSARDRFFAAGADIKLMAAVDDAAFAEYGDRLRRVLDRLDAYPGVTIAAIEGLALGGGLELALACTLRVAGADAQFGLPEVKLGLIPGAGGTQRLPRLVGRGRALDIILTARRVESDEAHSIGLVDRLVDAGNALQAAHELAAGLLTSSAPALLATIRSVDAAHSMPIDEGFAVERDEVGRLFSEEEGAEGIRAFVEKRKPRFS
jgi:enoyl-CoA hydratase/carnithine racemase